MSVQSTNRFADAPDLEAVIAQAVGAASMCWQHPERAGVYDTEEAVKVADDAVARILAPIRNLHQPAREGAWTVCAHCSAGASFVRWPCDTALLIYTSEELSNE